MRVWSVHVVDGGGVACLCSSKKTSSVVAAVGGCPRVKDLEKLMISGADGIPLAFGGHHWAFDTEQTRASAIAPRLAEIRARRAPPRRRAS